uniref:HAUS augmin-like complex, subunit 6 n=1 Tax=Scleropages formosus TaxID=113540 RepID=A0A8C9VN92_SCLFO
VMSELQKANAKHFWWALLCLGFEPEAAVSSSGGGRAMARHTTFGVNMFDKPNKNAFNVVTYFLLKKLNPTRAREVFRHCYPVLDRKADAEFRKVTLAWLQEIVGYGSDFLKVMPSLLLSPGGPKFINLMLHLAKHVMVEEMKSFSTDGSWVPEAAAAKAHSVEMALKRFQVVTNRFLQAAIEQDRVLHEYQHRVQTLVKRIRDLRTEEAKYDNLLKYVFAFYIYMDHFLNVICSQVRSLWADVDKMLSALEEERRVVDCVIKGNVDQYVLDGTDYSIKIPRVLLERMESDMGNVYEAGQIDALRLLELLRDSLHILQQERHLVLKGGLAPEFDLRHLEEQTQLLNRSLVALSLIGREITKEHIPEVKGSIRGMETTWDKKWADCLKQMPLTSFLNNDPALEFLSPMAPLSFEPATEANSSIFSQYPIMIFPKLKLSALKLVKLATISQASILRCTDTRDTCPKMTATKKKATILDRECDNLADQFAEAVTTNSSCRQQELEELLQTLPDPFSARKQLPRTPESLISEVKRSWRRAVEEGEAEKARLSMPFSEADENTPISAESMLAEEGAPPKLPEASAVHVDTLPLQHGFDSLYSTVSWHSGNMDASYSQSESDVIQFGIDQETMPESLDSNSFLSCSEGLPEEEDFSLPKLLPSSLEPQPVNTKLRAIQEASNSSSFLGCRAKCPGSPQPQSCKEGSPGAEGWKAGDKVFSLDLDALESPSHYSTERFSFPKLVTFSPMEEFLGP